MGEVSGACSALATGWPGIAVPPGTAHSPQGRNINLKSTPTFLHCNVHLYSMSDTTLRYVSTIAQHVSNILIRCRSLSMNNNTLIKSCTTDKADITDITYVSMLCYTKIYQNWFVKY